MILFSRYSAGGCAAVALGLMRDGDYCDEITVAEDITLATTHLGVSASVAAVVDLWGGAYVVCLLACG